MASTTPEAMVEESAEAPKDAEESAQETTTVLAIIQPDPMADIHKAAQQAEAIEEAESENKQSAEEAAAEEIDTQPETPATMEIVFNVTGEQRKTPVMAVSNLIGEPAAYQNG